MDLALIRELCSPTASNAECRRLADSPRIPLPSRVRQNGDDDVTDKADQPRGPVSHVCAPIASPAGSLPEQPSHSESARPGGPPASDGPKGACFASPLTVSRGHTLQASECSAGRRNCTRPAARGSTSKGRHSRSVSAMMGTLPLGTGVKMGTSRPAGRVWHPTELWPAESPALQWPSNRLHRTPTFKGSTAGQTNTSRR
jgi:hypothetical protein